MLLLFCAHGPRALKAEVFKRQNSGILKQSDLRADSIHAFPFQAQRDADQMSSEQPEAFSLSGRIVEDSRMAVSQLGNAEFW